MLLTLQIHLGLVALVCLLQAPNLLLKRAPRFLPESVPPQPILDNLFRFLSGIYFGLGFLMVWVVLNMEKTAI